MRILYVEDSASLRETVARGLRKSGYAVDVAADGDEGLDLALSGVYDLMILDVMLPKRSGIEVLREARASGIDAAVLLLTAKVMVADRVAGLESGADDYLIKPFAFEELMARVRTLLRRSFGSRSDVIVIGDLRIEIAAGRVLVKGVELPLRRREFALLEYLARRAGAVVSRFDIFDHVYDNAVDMRSNAIESAISILRKSLKDAGAADLIETVPRRGYIFAKDEEVVSS